MSHTRAIAGIVCVLASSLAIAEEARAQAPIRLVDSRPDSDRQYELMKRTRQRKNCDVGVERLADEASSPSRISALEAELAKQPAAALAGHTLTITSWALYYNRQAALERNYGMAGVLDPTARMGSRCPKDQSGPGWYEGKEVNGTESPIISEFTGDLDGQPIQVRVIQQSSVHLSGKFKGKPEDTAAVLDAVRKTAAAIVDAARAASAQQTPEQT
jgi:hypothetical protein